MDRRLDPHACKLLQRPVSALQHPNFECVGSSLSVHFQASVNNFQDGSGLLAELRVFDDSLNKAFEPMQCLGNETAHVSTSAEFQQLPTVLNNFQCLQNSGHMMHYLQGGLLR